MSRAGALYLILIGGMLAVAGGAFTWLMLRSFERAVAQEGWAEVPCRIVRSEVVERQIGPDTPVEYGYGVTFEYSFAGVTHAADTLSLRGMEWGHRREPAETLHQRYPEGSDKSCHVNPGHPAQAVLEIDSRGPGYSLWFPILFVVGGLVMIVNAVRVFVRAGRSARGDLDEEAALAGPAEGAPEEEEGEGEVDRV